ncbi:MAG: (Fe-S)-binding protein [Acetobacteraceae bacterium]
MLQPRPRVALFVTCLVDLHRPTVGFAAIRLLEQAGCEVHVPRAQTCCGQPAYNAGDRATARDIAAGIIEAFGGYDYVVVPSGSCGGMIAHHVPGLFDDDPNLRARAEALAGRTHELIGFLTDVMGMEGVSARLDGIATYHDSCSGLRELGLKQQPRRLLASVAGLELREMADPEVCCGFGGTFCVKYPEISTRMVSDKTRDITTTGADTLLAGDMGCLLNMAGRLAREGSPVKVRHVAEVLAGMTDEVPPIGMVRTHG